MPSAKAQDNKQQVNVRLSSVGRSLLEQLATTQGISQAAVIEIGLRKLAAAEGIDARLLRKSLKSKR
jgi:hypothetical protein